jgi:hypothetical protein
MSSMPPQRMGPAGQGAGGSPRGPGQPGGPARGLTLPQGALEAERRLGLPCYYAGQRVSAVVGCVACQFQINNRAALPTCPQCGELIWAYLGSGPRPIPDDETPVTPAASTTAQPSVTVQDGVSIGGDAPSVTVQEGVRLD